MVKATEAFKEAMVSKDEKITLTNMLVFLANVAHETTGDGYNSVTFNKGLFFVNEGGEAVVLLCSDNPGNQDWCASYGITPDKSQAYYGRGALQLSYEANYKAANTGIPNITEDIYENPGAVVQDSYLAWATGLWFWCTPQFNKPACSAVINGSWHPNKNDIAKGRINTTFANRMGVVTNIINGGIEAGSWDVATQKVKPLTPADSQENQQAINRQEYYQYFVNNFFAERALETMTDEECGFNQASHMANFNF